MTAPKVKDRQTRRPTGKPPWPIVLLAGIEKAGKSYKAAEATGSDLVGRSFWLSIGEDDPDEYGLVPGADFEIVQHDGTYRDLLDALTWAAAQPRVDGKPNLIIVDSFGRAWDLLSDMAQAEANKRRRGDGDAKIAPDLWNLAGQRWEHLLDVMRSHDGPVIVTARLERQTVFTEDGNPTKDRHNKVKAQKALPYDVGVVVELHAVGEAYIVGARSLALKVDPTAKLPNLTLDELWRRMGLAKPGATAARQHASIRADDTDPADEARAELLDVCSSFNVDPTRAAAVYRERYGVAVPDETDAERLRAFTAEIRDSGRRREAEAAAEQAAEGSNNTDKREDSNA